MDLESKVFGGIALAGILLVPSLFACQWWFEGHANAIYIKKVNRIELPWYYAAWLDVNQVNADVKTHKETPEK